MDQLLARAYRAYFMTAAKEGYDAVQPSEADSGREEVGGKSYIVLRNIKGILAVYRIRNDQKLKRLRRWPVALGEAAGGGYRDDWRYASLSPLRRLGHG